MKMSSAGRAELRKREGTVLIAYRDTVGVWTIGTGHTGRMSGDTVRSGMIITAAQSDAFLEADLAPVEAAIGRALKVPVSQNEFDAMASLWFNVGTGYVATSTIIKRLNVGDIAGAAAGFDAYHKPASIIGRRNSEKAQFLRPDAAIGAARATVLTTRAVAAKKTSNAAGSTGAAVVVAGAATVAATHAAHPSAAIFLGLGIVAAAVVAGFVFYLNHRSASVLTANAAK